MNMQHVRTWHLGHTHRHTDTHFADLGPIEHLFFLPRERRIMTSIIPRKLGRGKSPPRIIIWVCVIWKPRNTSLNLPYMLRVHRRNGQIPTLNF
jgi:hypothetical protein